MIAFYNDNDPMAAEWLIDLSLGANLIPRGIVDRRSIMDVKGADLGIYQQCHFFAGIGGWPLALRLAGWPDEWEVWTGSCPCQPFSCAGKQKGVKDERHLWPEFRRLIGFRRPAVIFGEQVASRLGREWLAGVRSDLEALGYAVGAADLCAAGVGAPHIRQRLFWGAVRVADSDRERLSGQSVHVSFRESRQALFKTSGSGATRRLQRSQSDGREQRRAEPGGRGVGGVADSERTGLEGWKGFAGDDGSQQQTVERTGDDVDGMDDTRSNRTGLQHAKQTEQGSNRQDNRIFGPTGCRTDGMVQSAGAGSFEGCVASSGTRHGSTAVSANCWTDSQAILCRDGKYRRIPQYVTTKPIFQLLANGLSSTMDSGWLEYVHKAKERIMSYAEKARIGPGEVLREVWNFVGKEEIQRSLGRQGGVYATEVLLVALCQLEGELGEIVDCEIPSFNAEENASVRAVRDGSPRFETTSRTSQERRHHGQQGEELGNLVCELSQIGASQKEALKVIHAVGGFPLSESLPGRVAQLRGLGNAIVPQVAATFVRAFMEALR